MHPYLIPVCKIFTTAADKERAVGAKAYMLNQFEFYGIVTAQRRKLSKEYMKANPLTAMKELEKIVKACWDLPERDYQYFAVELISFHKKIWTPTIIQLIEWCLVRKSWWDSVDHIASECLTDYFKLFPQQIQPITSKWNKSSNIWLQRSSIMFQKAFKKDTNKELLAAYILHCKDSKEFFVRKAIGWALREYSKTNAAWVKAFVQNNQLHALSAREALKRINTKK